MEVRMQLKTSRSRQLLSEFGLVLCLAPPSLPRDSRMNMMKRSIALTSGKCSVSVDEYKNCTFISLHFNAVLLYMWGKHICKAYPCFLHIRFVPISLAGIAARTPTLMQGSDEKE